MFLESDLQIIFEQEPAPEIAQALIEQVRQLEGVANAGPDRASAPEGAKAANAIIWSVVLVNLAIAVAPNAFGELVSWLRGWLRRPGAKALKLTVPMPDGSTLEIDPASESPESLRAKVDSYRAAFGGN